MNLKELAKKLNYLNEDTESSSGVTPTEPLEVELGNYGDRTFYIDPEDIKDFLAGEEVGANGDDGEDAYADIYNFDTFGGNARISKAGEEYLKSINLQIPKSHYSSTNEGTCGYAPDGNVNVNNTDKMTPAGPDLIKKIREVIKTEIKKLVEEPNEGNAFAVARLKAIKAGEKKFKLGDKEFDVTDVSDDDKKAAEEV